MSTATEPKAVEPFVVMAKPVGPVCNLACEYCYYLSKRALFPRGERFRMSGEVLEAYVRCFIAASPGPIVHFVWHGGEPTLAGIDFYRQALELQRRHLPEGWTCLNNLQTNGTLLDDDWCGFLAEHRFTVGLSIDGPARLHDAGRPDRRGRPSHRRVMEGMRALRAHGIEPDILCTLNARTAAAPLEVYRFFVEQRVRWLQFLPVLARDRAGTPSAWSVSPEAMGTFLCTVFDEWIRHDVGSLGVQNFLEPLLVVSGRPANLCIMSETCGRALALEHDGSVYSCDHFVDTGHRLGSVVDADLGTLVEGHRQTAFGAAKRDSLPPGCLRCQVGFLCRGGCPKDRFWASPGGGPPLNGLCGGYYAFYRHALPHLERMAALSRAGRPVTQIMSELEAEEAEERRRWRNASRNDPCPCGSGFKYKRCCLPARRD